MSRLIVVDDSPRARHGQCAFLQIQPGIEVVGEAADGKEALRLVASVQPDGVLMDVRMPGMDGLEATRLIKGRWPQVKVIVLSLYAAYQDEALSQGADAFLVKGRPVKDLLDILRNLLLLKPCC